MWVAKLYALSCTGVKVDLNRRVFIGLGLMSNLKVLAQERRVRVAAFRGGNAAIVYIE